MVLGKSPLRLDELAIRLLGSKGLIVDSSEAETLWIQKSTSKLELLEVSLLNAEDTECCVCGTTVLGNFE